MPVATIGYASAGSARGVESRDRHEVCFECNNNNDGRGAILQGYKAKSIVISSKYLPAVVCSYLTTNKLTFVVYNRMFLLPRRKERCAFTRICTALATGQQPAIAIVLLLTN